MCMICNKQVEIVEVLPREDHDEQFLSCGHHSKHVKREMKENISITDKVEAKVTKVKSAGEAPLFVTDSTGTHLTSGRVDLTTSQGTITGGTFYLGPVTYNMKVDANTTINNIQNILSMVDSNNNYTAEERVVIKDTLTKITELIQATGSTSGKIASLLSFLSGIFH